MLTYGNRYRNRALQIHVCLTVTGFTALASQHSDPKVHQVTNDFNSYVNIKIR
jgi:hypothetical protein